MVSTRFVAGVVVLTLVAVAVVLWVLPSSTDYSPANPRWNGLRVAAREFGLVGIPSLDALPSGPDRVLVILPSSPPTPAEAARLRAYLAGGGILVVMDDFGPGNAFLDALGIGARFAGQPLADGLFHYKNMRLPRIIDISPSPITGGVGQLILNHATVIAPLGDLRAVAYSSAVSYLDASGNGRHDAGETEGPFPVVALGPVGGGTLVLVSDSSLLLNSMLSLGGNRRLITNIVGLADPRARILLDEVHLPKMPLDVAKAGLRAAREILSTPLATFILAAGALAIPVMSLLRPVRR